MALPEAVSRQEWLAARRELLAREKANTRERDVINADRRRLPMVRVEKPYVFAGADGQVSLLDLFDGSRQLVVQHVMFDPTWETGCPSCSAALAEMSPGLLDHLRARDTAFAAVARAPIDKLEAYRVERGYPVRLVSSFDSDFNYDFEVTIDSSVRPVRFNFRELPELEAHGLGWLGEGSYEQPGISCFLRDGEDVFHTYSTYGRGSEYLGGAYTFLDLTALGRQEEWEEPKGRADLARAATPDFTA